MFTEAKTCCDRGSTGILPRFNTKHNESWDREYSIPKLKMLHNSSCLNLPIYYSIKSNQVNMNFNKSGIVMASIGNINRGIYLIIDVYGMPFAQ